MKYTLDTCVWEITVGCNYRCRHCGSACTTPHQDELTTQEAFMAADQIAALKPRYVSLTGGEPLLRRDWHMIVERMTRQGIAVCMITNGALIDEATAGQMESSGLALVSISMDGTRQIHNHMRGIDCYDRSLQAYRLLADTKVATGANTTLVKENITCLEELRLELMAHGVDKWQLQLGLPVGTLRKNSDSVLEPEALERVIDFVYESNVKGGIEINLAESAGYYSRKEAISRQIANRQEKVSVFKGCNAGIRSVGILQNGDVVACTSIRDPGFVEGNIRERTLAEIWEDEDSFAWRRKMNVEMLQGFCRKCRYGEICLGGCTNSKLTMTGSMYGENRYCVYHLACVRAGEVEDMS